MTEKPERYRVVVKVELREGGSKAVKTSTVLSSETHSKKDALAAFDLFSRFDSVSTTWNEDAVMITTLLQGRDRRGWLTLEEKAIKATFPLAAI